MTGKPPYYSMPAMAALWHIVEEDCPPIPPSFSPELQDLLRQCFRKVPSERPTAEMLFRHAWLGLNWDLLAVSFASCALWQPKVLNFAQDLRTQDSIPFIKRISHDFRRNSEDVFSTSALDAASLSAPALTSPLASSPSAPVFLEHLASSADAVAENGRRVSFDQPRRPVLDRSGSPEVSPSSVVRIPFSPPCVYR